MVSEFPPQQHNPNENENGVLARAMKLAREKYPEASPQKHAAFANAVQMLVNHEDGGYGGPSIRDQLAVEKYLSSDQKHTFEEATKLLLDKNGPIFGPLTQKHIDMFYAVATFDNDPDDLAFIESGNQLN